MVFSYLLGHSPFSSLEREIEMEGKKRAGSSSSSSFATDLFGSKESSYPSPSSTGIFASIFSTSSKVLGRESLRPDLTKKKQDSGNEVWNAKPGTTENALQQSEGESQSISNRDTGSFYQEQRVQPCHLSSSIYYGGQDIYFHPQNSQSSGMPSMLKKDSGEDDTGSASRGNWWQGSLYY